MKKPQVILIGTILVLLHLALFVWMLLPSANPPAPAPQPAAPAQQTSASVAPEQPPAQHDEPKHGVQFQPIDLVSMETGNVIQRVETAPNKIGYLQNNKTPRRTSKVYSKLVRTPYQSAIVVDAKTGKILFEDRPTSYSYPASVTKLMTMLLILEKVEQKQMHLSDMVQIHKDACAVGGSQVYLDPREAFSIDDLLNALIIHSACDAASALAIHMSGSQSVFVERMNQKAKKLGMNATVFHTPHGLPPGGGRQPDISTAYDIALLCREVLKYKDTLRYTGTTLTWLPQTQIRKEKFMLANRNALVKSGGYEGCDGLKTGFHNAGGWSLAATAERNGRRVIAIALGCPDKTTRNNTVKKLMDKGFEKLN